MSDVNMWEIEHSCFEEGYRVICGVDEAGRGPLAGPVCAAAVILPAGLEIPGLNDSKKLTDKKRRELMTSSRSRPSPGASPSPTRKKLTRSTFCRQPMPPCTVPSISLP